MSYGVPTFSILSNHFPVERYGNTGYNTIVQILVVWYIRSGKMYIAGVLLWKLKLAPIDLITGDYFFSPSIIHP